MSIILQIFQCLSMISYWGGHKPTIIHNHGKDDHNDLRMSLQCWMGDCIGAFYQNSKFKKRNSHLEVFLEEILVLGWWNVFSVDWGSGMSILLQGPAE